MEIAITGSSGLIGSTLMSRLGQAGHRPVAVVRRAPLAGADEIRWDPTRGEIDVEGLDGIDAVVHLAGAGIGDRRWNARFKELLVTSRTIPTGLLASTLARLNRPPSCLLSASAIGFYGSRGDEILSETSAGGSGFLAELAREWEEAARPAADAGIRTAYLRTGIVLTTDGGALAKMLPLFRMGLGGRFGNGGQYMSWITLHDTVRAIEHLLGADTAGPVNLTAPQAITNTAFSAALGSALGRPTFLPVPSRAPKLLLGTEMAQALLLDGQRVEPRVLVEAGFEFDHPDIDTGLAAVLGV